MKKVYAIVVILFFFSSAQSQQCWQSISAGGSHTMAVKPDGTLWAWGSNYYGQLGNNFLSSSALPVRIGTDTNWKLVVAGENNTFAIKTDGTLWGWGENALGQIGDGTILSYVGTPTRIGSAANWKSVAAAPTFTAAIRTDGTLWTWGENTSEQLGYPFTSIVPKKVGTATDWKEVSVGDAHTVALKTDNTLWAWGSNNSAQIGNGTPSEPVKIFQIGSSEWQSVSAGSDYTMAIKLDGTLWGWGSNYTGQLGVGNQSPIYAPAQVGVSNWKSVDAARGRTIGIRTNGTLWMWGDRIPGNIYDELYLVPHQRTTYSDWETVSMYSAHSFSFRSDKSAWSEGNGSNGKLGEYVEYRLEPEPFSVVTPTGDAVQTICGGGTVADLKATGTDLQWYDVPSGGSPIPATTILVHGNRYYASSTRHGCESSLRLDVTVVINPAVTPPPTAPAEQKFCDYLKISALEITGSNIKWYDSNFSTNELASSSYIDNRTFYATQTLGYCESEAIPVKVIVSTTYTPTGDAVQTRCPGSTLSSLTVSGNNLKYYQTETSTTPLAPNTVLSSGAIFVTQTNSDYESCGRLRVVVTVKTSDQPIGDPEQVLCSSDRLVSRLKAMGEEIQWFDSPTGGNNVTYTLAINGNYYYAEQSIHGCISSTRLKVKAIISSTPYPEYTGPYTHCAGTTLGDIPLNGTNIRWYGPDGAELPSSTLVKSRAKYFASQTVGGLESCARWPLDVSILPPTGPFLDPTVYVCNGGTVADLYSRNMDTNLTWYESASGNIPLPITTPLIEGKHYWATITWSGCESPERSETILKINPTPTPPMTGGGTIVACNGWSFNLPVQGTDIKWYETSTSTTPMSSSILVVHGENYFGTQTINGCESPRTEYIIDMQTPPPAPAAFAEPEWKSISATSAPGNLGIRKDGTLWAWGKNDNGQLNNGVPGDVLTWATPISFETWKFVEVGDPESFAIKSDGTLWHWGRETVFSNDRNDVNKFSGPAKIGSDNTWEKISTGSGFTFGIKTDGSLWAWGSNFYGTYGDGSLVSSNTPKQVGSTTGWVEVSVGGDYVLAIKSDGTLWGWGEHSSIVRQQPYNYRVLTPTQIGTSNKWRKIKGGAYYWFGIQDDGSLWIGGYKYVGTSGSTFSSIDPEKFNSDTDWKEISVGSNHVMGIKNNGTLWAVYGANESGQMGFDRPLPPFANNVLLVPRQIGTDSDWKMVETGTTHSLAMKNDGSLWTCGANTNYGLAVHPKYQYQDMSDYYRDRFTPIRSVLIDTECKDLTLADLRATGANIEWTDVIHINNPLPLTTPLINGAKFFGQQTTSICPSADKFFYQANVIPIPKPIGSVLTQLAEVETQAFCNGASVADLVAFGADIKWYDAPTGGAQLPSTSLLVDNQHYYASQSFNNCEGTDRLEVIASVGPSNTPSGNLTQRFCYGGTVGELVATGTNIKWYGSEVSETPLPSSTALVDNTYYYATQTLTNGCESVSRLAVLVSVGTPAPTANVIQSFCLVASVANLTAIGSSIKWYTTASGGAPIDGQVMLVDGHHYFASQSIDGCESKSRFEVTVSLAIPAPIGNTIQSFCLTPNVIALVATGIDIKWYATPGGGSPLSESFELQDGHHYYASQTVDECESPSRLDVFVSLGTRTPGGDPSQTVCPGSTVADLVVDGNDIKWYSQPSGGEELLSTSLAAETTYYATQTINDCESKTRFSVTVTVGVVPPTLESSQHFTCGSTVADLTATGSMIKWYSTSGEGTPLPAETNLVDGMTYYASQTINLCESDRVATVVSIGPLDAPGGDAEQTFCSDGKVLELIAIGSNIKWYEAETGGTAIDADTQLADGTHYYAEQSNSVCTSATRLEVLVSINEPSVPGGQALQVMEEGKKISDLVVTGENITWYGTLEDARQGVNPLLMTAALVNEKSYFATQTFSSCESDPLEVQVVFEVTQGLEPDQPGIRIYPIPAGNVFFIDSDESIDRISIVSVVGRTLVAKTVNGNKAEFDLSGFASGIYFVHIDYQDQTIVRKLVKD